MATFPTDGNDTITGGSGNDRIDALRGNDFVNGAGGNDTLYGGYDRDTLRGGDGNDSLDGGGATFYDSSSDALYGDAGNDTLLGGNGADTLDGGTGNDSLNGWNGNDILYGNRGNDRVDGGAGADTLLGSLSTSVREDTLFVVDNSGDKIVDLSGTGIETVLAYISWDLRVSWNPNNFNQQNATSGLDHLTLAGSAVNGTGNQVDNTITGNGLNNTLNGLEGNDRLLGRGGDDNLLGGFGNDSLMGEDGTDRLNGYGTTVTSASQFDTLDGGAGVDYFILGGAWGISYVEPGDGYAVINNWDWANDWVDVRGSGTNASQFRLDKFRSVVGGAGLDTEIYYGSERIGIVQDTTNVEIGRDFRFT
ncbi:MAG: calcium-binding protein [Cyanobacteria bacterium RU_5_0]|nr:calcium-binding protein [Cyanobacteria bacterium RU_5_0]